MIKRDDWIIASWRESLKRQQAKLERVCNTIQKVATWHKACQDPKVIDSMNCILAAIGEIRCAVDCLKAEDTVDENIS